MNESLAESSHDNCYSVNNLYKYTSSQLSQHGVCTCILQLPFESRSPPRAPHVSFDEGIRGHFLPVNAAYAAK